ncbi:MAG TPA: hypothetical protein VGQ51_08280 [Puia sp.]|jgi:hypothetical protein|nr:hypothetical protein [Puia sp.]
MRKLSALILLFYIIPSFCKAQHDILVLEKRGMHVRTYTIGDPMTFRTVYDQWFTGTIDDLHRDTVFIAGQSFSYKEIAAISRIKTKWDNRTTGAILTMAGIGFFAIGAINGALRGDEAKEWYTTSGVIIGGALITAGVVFLATSKKYYRLGGKYKLQYLQIGRR